MRGGFPEVPCDLWIIRDWQANEALRTGAVATCNAFLAESLDDEAAGYGLPDGYTAGPRVHVFANADCEVWFGCFDPTWCDAILVSDVDMAEAVTEEGGPYALLLDGRAVVGVYSRS